MASDSARGVRRLTVSGWGDSNSRPLVPQTSALTKLRHSPYVDGRLYRLDREEHPWLHEQLHDPPAQVGREQHHEQLEVPRGPGLIGVVTGSELVRGERTDQLTPGDLVGMGMVQVMEGRYGPYVTEVLPEGSPKSAKPRTASIFASICDSATANGTTGRSR